MAAITSATPDASGQHIDAFVNPIDAPPGMMTKTLDETTIGHAA